MAAALALVAAFLFALAATLQQKGSLNLPTISVAHPMSLVRLVGQTTWLMGTLALFIGYAFQAGALDRGRLSIIQPLLVTTVVFVLPMGYFLTGQHVGKREVIGAAVILMGLGLFVYFGDPAGGAANASNTQWAVTIGALSLLCVLLLVLGSNGGLSKKAAVYGTVAGILFGLSSSLTKPTLDYFHRASARCCPTGSATRSRRPPCSGSCCSRCRWNGSAGTCRRHRLGRQPCRRDPDRGHPARRAAQPPGLARPGRPGRPGPCPRRCGRHLPRT